MHPEARNFTVFVKSALPGYFVDKKVLDVGSGDINGNNRFLFDNCTYDGNDVIQANNVTVVSKTKDLPFEDDTFDTIISTECFEHDPEYKESFLKIYRMLKPGGLFCFTCASTGRWEHGTRRTSRNDSYGTVGNLVDMQDYYKNLTEIDLNNVLNLQDTFSVWNTYYNRSSCDLYFVGIKKGDGDNHTLSEYVENNVVNTTPNVHNNNLHNIFDKFDTDKQSYFHNYSRQYESLLAPYRNKKIKYLEIGVFNGGSLKAMCEVFKNSVCIVGVDINHHCKISENVTENKFVEIGDATDPNFIRKIHEKYGSFDVILDDGSHRNRDVINAFESWFPLLSDDGLYIVEDTIVYKVPGYVDSNYPNHLEYFFKYTSFLNQWRYDSHSGIKDHCVDPFKIIKKTNNVFEYSIDKIEYGCSYVAVHKKVRKHWISE